MFIARATCESEAFGDTEVVICTERDTAEKYIDKNTDELMYVSCDMPITKAIMQAAASNALPTYFECNGTKYKLTKYVVNSIERYYNKYRNNYVEYKEKCRPTTEIFVYTQRCRCFKCYSEYGFDNIISICGLVPLKVDKRKYVEIDLHKCTRCNCYFIDAQSLDCYEQINGELSIIKHHITGNEIYNDDAFRGRFNPDSILSRNGYSTKKGNLERKQILINMMESGIKKEEIIDKLSEFIYFRNERFPEASAIWKEDLEFVNNYKLGTQEIMIFI